APHLGQVPPPSPAVAWDLSHAYSVSPVARRILLETAKRLEDEGREVILIDPDSVLPDPDRGDGRRLAVAGALADIVGAEALVVPGSYTEPSRDTPTPDVPASDPA